jgi:hypothetical protein
MGHAKPTHDPHDPAPGTTHVAQPLDPEHDIDARSATWWFVGGSIAVFLCLWVMVPIFIRVQEEERKVKIDLMPNTEYLGAKGEQDKFLAGQNPKGLSIQQAMQQIVRK